MNLSALNSDADSDLNNISFHVNKSGIPVNASTWDRMWKYAAKLNPEKRDKIYEIKNSMYLPPVRL